MPWNQLKSIADSQRAFNAQYNSQPPEACPACGTPLEVGQQTQPGGGKQMVWHCPMGHFQFTGGRRPV